MEMHKIEVKSYMLKKATPDFDFMQKWNNDGPMPLKIMVGTVVKETKGMVYMKLHGDIFEEKTCHCMKCGKFYDVDYVMSASGVPKCSCGGTVKPDVVLYEEPLDDRVVSGAISAIASADTLIIIGTSLVVYPAASYVRYFRGKNLVIINLEPTQMDSIATLAIYDDVVNVVAGLEK